MIKYCLISVLFKRPHPYHIFKEALTRMKQSAKCLLTRVEDFPMDNYEPIDYLQMNWKSGLNYLVQFGNLIIFRMSLCIFTFISSYSNFKNHKKSHCQFIPDKFKIFLIFAIWTTAKAPFNRFYFVSGAPFIYEL